MKIKELVAHLLSVENQEQEVKIGGVPHETCCEEYSTLQIHKMSEIEGCLRIDISYALSEAYTEGVISEPDPWDSYGEDL